jgi:hypothetical protein
MGCEKARIFTPDLILKTRSGGEIKLALLLGFD